jgi:hypothetical protein
MQEDHHELNRSRVVVQRVPTPAPGTYGSDSLTGPLPDDLLSDQVRRLMLFAAVAVGAWTFGIVVEWTFASVMPNGAQFPLWKSRLVEATAVIVSAVMWVYVRYHRDSAEHKIDIGLVYLNANAFLVAMLNTWVMTAQTVTGVQPSWNTVLILVYAMIVPAAQPQKMLLAALAAASMDPLGMWLAHLRGTPTPSPLQTLILYLPNYVYAVVATLPAYYLRRLGRQLRSARDMGSYHLVEKLGEGGMMRGAGSNARHRSLRACARRTQ